MNKLTKTILGNELGLLIGSLISLTFISPEQALLNFLILNMGYFLAIFMFYDKIKDTPTISLEDEVIEDNTRTDNFIQV